MIFYYKHLVQSSQLLKTVLTDRISGVIIAIIQCRGDNRMCKKSFLKGIALLFMGLPFLLTASCKNISPFDAGLSFDGLIQSSMMYQQNCPVNVWGKADAGLKVEVTLKNISKNTQETLSVVSEEDSQWSVSFPAKAASFDVYKITAAAGGASISAEDILIGDIWLSSGQSNMNLELQYSYEAQSYHADNVNIRLLSSNTYLPFGEDGSYPLTPLDTLQTPYWRSAVSTEKIGAVSAIGYSFISSLYSALKADGREIPLGLIHTAVGATGIDAWIGRIKTESNPGYKNALVKYNRYISVFDWNNSPNTANYNQMSAMYNTKIGPLSKLSVAGVLWMQGENNVGEIAVYNQGTSAQTTYDTREILIEGLPVLIEEFSDTFNSPEPLPFICGELMPHYYDYFGTGYQHTALPYTIEGFDIALRSLTERGYKVAMIPSYDAGLEWTQENNSFSALHPVHPLKKKLLGERMALAAMDLVYDGKTNGLAPQLSSVEITDNNVFLKFNNVGEGLKTIGSKTLTGFTIASENLVYINALAEIVSSDTVRIWHPSISNPYAVTYAYTSMHDFATLCNSQGVPAIPFRTDTSYRRDVLGRNGYAYYALPNLWMDCESLQIWSYTSPTNAAWNDKYTGSSIFDKGSIEIDISTTEKTSGAASLKIDYTPEDGLATFGPELSYISVLTAGRDYEQFLNLHMYNYLKMDIKNNDSRPKELKIAVSGIDGKVYYLAFNADFKVNIDMLNQFVTYTADLSKYYTEDFELIIGEIPSVNKLQFILSDTLDGSILIDNIHYSF